MVLNYGICGHAHNLLTIMKTPNQPMGMSIFSLFQSFRHGSLPTLSGCRTGMRFGKLHLEHPREDLEFLGSPEALPQLQGLLVILLIQSK